MHCHGNPTVILGGTPEFMAVYLEKAGGMEAVKARFQFDDILRGGWPSLLGDAIQEEVDRFYAMLGWEPPDYEAGWKRLKMKEW